MGKGWLGRTGQICMGYPLGNTEEKRYGIFIWRGKRKARKGCGCYRCLRAVMWRLLRWIKRDYARRFSADKFADGLLRRVNRVYVNGFRVQQSVCFVARTNAVFLIVFAGVIRKGRVSEFGAHTEPQPGICRIRNGGGFLPVRSLKTPDIFRGFCPLRR